MRTDTIAAFARNQTLNFSISDTNHFTTTTLRWKSMMYINIVLNIEKNTLRRMSYTDSL